MPHVSGHKSSGVMSNPYKQAAESMKAAGIGSISGKPISAKAKKIQKIYYDSNRNQSQRQPGINQPPSSPIPEPDSNGLLVKKEDEIEDSSVISTVKNVGQEVIDVGKDVIDSVKTGEISDTVIKGKDALMEKLPKGSEKVAERFIKSEPLFKKEFSMWGGTGTVTLDPLNKSGGFFLNWTLGGDK